MKTEVEGRSRVRKNGWSMQRWVVVVIGERVDGLGSDGVDDIRGQECPHDIELCAAADPAGLKKKRPGWSKSRVKITWKRLGEIAEAAFLAKAAELGFGVMKPWGDSEPYDFVLDGHRGRAGLWRVQVKSAHREGVERGYSFRAHGHRLEAYKARDVDALVAYVVPEDAWYVFPIGVFRKRRSVVLYPGSKRRRSKFEEYRDGWWRLTDTAG